MRDFVNNLKETWYRVRLGHNEVTVCGNSREDALVKAKDRLCQDMPRLWDVIDKLDASRFVIVPAE